MAPDYKENIGLIHLITRKCMGWVMALGVQLDYEDVMQEVSLAFVTASRQYDPATGIRFSAYLTRAAYNQIRKTVGVMTGAKRLNDTEKQLLARLQEENKELVAAGRETKSTYFGLSVVAIEDMVSEENPNPIDMFAAAGKNPEVIASETQEWENAVSQLSPLALLLADMLKEPPAALLSELQSQFEFEKIAVEKKLMAKARRPFVTLKAVSGFVAKISDVTPAELLKAEAELISAAAKI